MRTLRCLIACFLLSSSAISSAQVNGSSTGREFWFGFMRNYDGATDMRVFISSQVSTSGTVSAPLLGWSQAITVDANGVTEVQLPTYLEHFGSEFVDNKGVHVSMDDSCTVYALSSMEFTSDAALILPQQALGRDHVVQAYMGLQGYDDLSEALIVCASDSSVIEITPSCYLLGGHQPLVPYTITLHAGESYQLQAANPVLDVSGTRIRAIGQEDCHPFAVFGGSACTDVPSFCYACDHLFEQMTPLNAWGQRYFLTPFTTQNSYAFRVTAGDQNVSITMDGAPAVVVPAGQFHEWDFVYGAHCLSGDAPFGVAQYMQGADCTGGLGDPSMVLVNKDEQVMRDVTFRTINTWTLPIHFVNVVTTASNAGTLMLDSVPVDAAIFQPFPECEDRVWGTVQVMQGQHRLTAQAGFSAVVYGVGGEYDSYAYSLGTSISSVLDTTMCHTGGPLTLNAPAWMNDPYWYGAQPADTLGYGPSLTISPSSSTTVTVMNIGGAECAQAMRFHIEVGVPFQLEATATPDTVCYGDSTLLIATAIPPLADLNIVWSPTAGLADPYSASTMAYPPNTIAYTAQASTPLGCWSATGSVVVLVTYPPIPQIMQNGDILYTGLYATYQWYHDGVLIPGATGQELQISVGGTYSVVVTDDNGCTGSSNNFQVIITGVATNASPSLIAYTEAGTIVVNTAEPGQRVELFDVLGQCLAVRVPGSGQLRLDVPSEGAYFVRIGGRTQRVVVLRY